MERIVKKITFVKKEQSIQLIEDFTEYAKELIECNNVFDDTKEKMDEHNISKFFENGIFTTQDFQLRNGIHFLFGYIEALSQSESFQYLFETEIDKLLIEDVESNMFDELTR